MHHLAISTAQVPVAQGALATLQGLTKPRVADFVHGTDGFGNLAVPRKPSVSEHPCTNTPGSATVVVCDLSHSSAEFCKCFCSPDAKYHVFM